MNYTVAKHASGTIKILQAVDCKPCMFYLFMNLTTVSHCMQWLTVKIAVKLQSEMYSEFLQFLQSKGLQCTSVFLSKLQRQLFCTNNLFCMKYQYDIHRVIGSAHDSQFKDRKFEAGPRHFALCLLLTN